MVHTHSRFAAAIGALLFLCQSVFAASFGLQLTRYDLHVTIPAHADSAQVSVECTLSRTDPALPTVMLLASSTQIHSITMNAGAAGPIDVSYRRPGGDTLILTLPADTGASHRIRLRLTYAVPITPLGDTVMLMLDRGHRWYPLVPDQVARFTLRCDVPKGYRVLSSGNELSSTTKNGMTTSMWTSVQPVFKIPLLVAASGMLHAKSLRSSGATFVLYSSLADTTSVRILSEAARVTGYFANSIGAYPYQHLTFVEVPFFEGMNIASGLVMVGSSFIKAMAQGDNDGIDLAVAEQWIGAGVFGQYGARGFLFTAISMPQYLRLMYVRHQHGEDAYASALFAPLKQYELFAGKAGDVAIMNVNAPDTKEKGVILYGKGPYVLSRLHETMGDKRWRALWKDVVTRFRGRVLSIDGFRACVARHDRGGKASEMLDHMLNETGMPEG